MFVQQIKEFPIGGDNMPLKNVLVRMLNPT